MKKSSFVFLLIFGFALVVSAQESDDLYFNSTDRKKQKKERIKELEAELQFLKSEDYALEEDTSVNQVDPELISQYEDQARESSLEYQSSYNSANQLTNSNYGEEPLSFQYDGDLNDQYYYEDEGSYDDQGAAIINNYYGNDYQRGRYGRYGYNSFWMPYGFLAGWPIGIGGGFGSFCYDPFYAYDPWCYNSWNYGYNPWNYGYAYNSFGRNPWRRSGFFYGYGAYGGYYNGYHIADNTKSNNKKRGVIRGARVSRGGAVVSGNTGRGSSTRNNSAGLSDRRNYSRTQKEYLSKSRSSIGRSGSSSTLGVRQGATTLNSNRSSTGVKYSRGNSSADRSGQSVGNTGRSDVANSGKSEPGYSRYGNARSSGSSTKRSTKNKSYGSQRSGSSGNAKSNRSSSSRNSYNPSNSRPSSNSGSLRSNSSRSSGFKPSRFSSSSYKPSSSSGRSGSGRKSGGFSRSSSSSKSRGSSSKKRGN